jgi:hypothetical protein
MRHKGYKLAGAALVLMVALIHLGPSYCRVARSAQSFQQYFDSLDDSNAHLNSIERLVFSLILANGGGTQDGRGAAPRRTS